jgi:hypothetical protein
LKLFGKHLPGLGDRGKLEDVKKESNGMEAIVA